MCLCFLLFTITFKVLYNFIHLELSYQENLEEIPEETTPTKEEKNDKTKVEKKKQTFLKINE